MKITQKNRFSGSQAIRRSIASGRIKASECGHLREIQDVQPSTEGCEDCLKVGDVWVHLRICLICGHVGCCDNSKNKHATRHFDATGHPLIQSFEPGEEWLWCYADQVLIAP
jgi:uncharacterized UBP type Zn finger protein